MTDRGDHCLRRITRSGARTIVLWMVLAITTGCGGADGDTVGESPTTVTSPAPESASAQQQASPVAATVTLSASSTPTTLASPVTSAGLMVALIDVKLTEETTVLTFRVTDAELDQAPTLAAYEGLLPSDIDLDHLAWQETLVSKLTPVFDSQSLPVAIDEELHFEPIVDLQQPIAISWTRMTFKPDSRDIPFVEVFGTWEFQIIPAEFAVQ